MASRELAPVKSSAIIYEEQAMSWGSMKMKGEPLRVCWICYLEAHTEEDLEQFVKDEHSLHGRLCLCKKCQGQEQHHEVHANYLLFLNKSI